MTNEERKEKFYELIDEYSGFDARQSNPVLYNKIVQLFECTHCSEKDMEWYAPDSVGSKWYKDVIDGDVADCIYCAEGLLCSRRHGK